MENNDNEMRSIHEYVEDSAPVEPVVEAAVEEPVVEAPVEVVEESSPVVEAPAVEEPVQALGFLNSGAIGSMAADGPKKTIKPAHQSADKVAIYSTKNVRWEEVGSLSRGYNIVTKEQADKWLTRSHVRTATPEEVKKVLG